MPLQPPVSYRDFPDFRRGQTGGGSANLLNLLTNITQKKTEDARLAEEERKKAERQAVEDKRYETKEGREAEKWEAEKEDKNYKETKAVFEENLQNWRLEEPEAAAEDIGRALPGLEARLHSIWGPTLPEDVQNNLDQIGGVAAGPQQVAPIAPPPQAANMLGAPGQGLPGPPQQAAPQAAPKPDVLSGLRMWKESIAKAPVVGSERWQNAEIFKENLKTPGYGSQFRAVGPDGTERFYRINKKTNKAEPVDDLLPPPKSEESITVGPDGAVSIRRGAGALTGGGIQDKKLKTDVTKKLFNATESLARLNAIGTDITDKPELMNFWHRAGAKLKSIGKRTGVYDLSEEDTKQLEGLRVFQRKAIENINSYIKEITGAQMSEKEADRIRKAMPDPGEGVWPAESYSEFMAALNDAKKQNRLAISRYQYLLKEDISPEAIKKLMEPIDPQKPELGAPIDSYLPLDSFKQKINTRGKELEKEGKSEEEIDAILIKEFVL